MPMRGQMTAQTLAADFEVSASTITPSTAIATILSAVNPPVYADRGPNRGFERLDG
jgi:hypothetical protein